MVSFRIDIVILDEIKDMAHRDGLDTGAYIHRLLRLHVSTSDHLSKLERGRIILTEKLLDAAGSKARELEAAGKFDERFTLTVITALFEDLTFRTDYEQVIGGDAMSHGLPAKASLNMNLGWHIKTVVGAEAMTNNGKPRRAQVRNMPIQSYTLLCKKTC